MRNINLVGNDQNIFHCDINNLKNITKNDIDLLYVYIFDEDFDKNIIIQNINIINKIFYKNYYIFNQLYNICLDKHVELERIRVITFGTFDLFHRGHKNLLNRCKKYSTRLIIGISSDELNLKKGKVAFDNINKRIDNVKKYNVSNEIFIEESLELKNEYIKKYNANILIMGDDWKDKFNWVDVLCIYLPRTPNISSTILRNQLNFNPPNYQE
jgi:glycerol-3-phosphate cytidylyltransferase